jgi:hypothetical protein
LFPGSPDKPAQIREETVLIADSEMKEPNSYWVIDALTPDLVIKRPSASGKIKLRKSEDLVIGEGKYFSESYYIYCW